MSADTRVVIHLLKCGPPLDKEPSREGIKLSERMASRLKDFEAYQLEVDEDKQLKVVEEEDWDPQDELMNVERQASSGHMITFSGGTLVSEERVRLQLDFGCVRITMEEDKVAEKINKGVPQKRDNILKVVSLLYRILCHPRVEKLAAYAWFEAGYTTSHPGLFENPSRMVFSEVIGPCREANCEEPIMIGTGVPAPYLCMREVDVMNSAKFLSDVFPNARFVFMIRDGRSVVDNIMEDKAYLRTHNISDFGDGLEDWDSRIEIMDKQCTAVGDRCLRVYYEALALHPERELRRVLNFLGLPWIDGVLRPNQEHMDEEATIWWMRNRPRNQAIRPVALSRLSRWVGRIPEETLQEMSNLAPMLAKLGYDPHENPPNYKLLKPPVQRTSVRKIRKAHGDFYEDDNEDTSRNTVIAL